MLNNLTFTMPAFSDTEWEDVAEFERSCPLVTALSEASFSQKEVSVQKL